VVDFGAWSLESGVHIESTEEDRERGELFAIFRVPEGKAPFWPAERFGLPNTAEPSIRSKQDVVQAPAPEGFHLQLPSAEGIGTIALAVLVYLIIKSGRESTRERRRGFT
jgi:hypothetical protein